MGEHTLSSHKNLPAHANKRVLSPVFILFSLISTLAGTAHPRIILSLQADVCAKHCFQGESKGLSHHHYHNEGCTSCWLPENPLAAPGHWAPLPLRAMPSPSCHQSVLMPSHDASTAGLSGVGPERLGQAHTMGHFT